MRLRSCAQCYHHCSHRNIEIFLKVSRTLFTVQGLRSSIMPDSRALSAGAMVKKIKLDTELTTDVLASK